MAYSENIKKLAVNLCQDGQSPEDVVKLFSRYLLEGPEKGYAYLKKLAKSKSLAFTEIEWQELNEGLPEGKTIRGWYSRYKSKPAARPDGPEEIPNAKEKELRLTQEEHIRKIQNLARTAFDSLPGTYPFLSICDSKDQTCYEFNEHLVEVIRRLTGDFEWQNLKDHLGKEGLEIENKAKILNDSVPELAARNITFDEYFEEVVATYNLLKYGGLKVITETCDTRVWNRHGLQPVCQHCPDQGNSASAQN